MGQTSGVSPSGRTIDPKPVPRWRAWLAGVLPVWLRAIPFVRRRVIGGTWMRMRMPAHPHTGWVEIDEWVLLQRDETGHVFASRATIDRRSP